MLRKNPITHIADLMQNMQSTRNNWVAKAEKIDQRWAQLYRKDKGQYRTMAKIMYEATLTGIDPRLPQGPDTLDADYNRIKTLWNTLSPETQALFGDVEQHYKDQYRATVEALIERANGLFEPREAHDAIKKLKEQFGQVEGPYFPLMRYGNFYIKGKDAKGKEYREHFVKEGEYLAARKQLIDAGITITEDGRKCYSWTSCTKPLCQCFRKRQLPNDPCTGVVLQVMTLTPVGPLILFP